MSQENLLAALCIGRMFATHGFCHSDQSERDYLPRLDHKSPRLKHSKHFTILISLSYRPIFFVSR